jgi:shikimate kinase/3-dehydroquinate synthase
MQQEGQAPTSANALALSTQLSALVFLIGLSGAGKSSIGHLLAERLGVPFLDTDAEIERLAGQSVAAVFASRGEAAFRVLEREVVAAACALPAGVIATGGGAPVDPTSRAAMGVAGCVFWLDAPVEELATRLQAEADPNRPLLAGDLHASLRRLHRERGAIYAETGRRIDASGATPGQVVDRIMAILEGSDPVWVRTPSQTYPVYIGSGILSQAGELLRRHDLEGRLRVIADEHVGRLHGEQLRAGLGELPQAWYPVPAGEEHKTLDQAAELFDRLLADGPERRDIIVAFGGGVVGDLAGFVAATLLRGLRFVQIPTTLLSQVDSSVGGKVGVDHPRGKNLIGAFHQPHLVLADVDLLRTLPAREIAAGWTEVVKIAVIQDADLFTELEGSVELLRALEPRETSRAIRRAVELKARVVERDERDLTGVRAILNYGHTLGHALEAATDYSSFLHGEAVAVGMAGAAHIAQQLGLHPADAVDRQTQLLQSLGLPQSCPAVSKAELRAAMGLDKKRHRGRITWVLPTGIGQVRTSTDVPAKLVDDAIDLLTQHRSQNVRFKSRPGTKPTG